MNKIKNLAKELRLVRIQWITYKGVAPGVGPLLGLVDLLESLSGRGARLRARILDLEGLEGDLLLLELCLNLGFRVLADEVGDDVEDLDGQVGQVLERHHALERGPESCDGLVKGCNCLYP